MASRASTLGLVALVAMIGVTVALSVSQKVPRRRLDIAQAAYRPEALRALRDGACERLHALAYDPGRPDSLHDLLAPLPAVCDRMQGEADGPDDALAILRAYRDALVSLSDSSALDSLPGWVEHRLFYRTARDLVRTVCAGAVGPRPDSADRRGYRVLPAEGVHRIPDSLRVTGLSHLLVPVLVFCDSTLGRVGTRQCGPYCCTGPTYVTWTRSRYRFRLVRWPEATLYAEETVEDEVCPQTLGAEVEATDVQDPSLVGRWVTRQLLAR